MSSSPRRPPSVPNLRAGPPGQTMSNSSSREPIAEGNYPHPQQQQQQTFPNGYRPPSVTSSGSRPRPTIDTNYQNQQHPNGGSVLGQAQPQQYYQSAPPVQNLQDSYYANAPRDANFASISSRKSQMTLPVSAVEARDDQAARRVSAAQGPLLDQCKSKSPRALWLLGVSSLNLQPTFDPETKLRCSHTTVPSSSTEKTLKRPTIPNSCLNSQSS